MMKTKNSFAIASVGMASAYDYEQSFVVGSIGMMIWFFGILWLIFFMYWIIELLSHE